MCYAATNTWKADGSMTIPKGLKYYVEGASIALTVADPAVPDIPLALANDAFCQLTGFARAQLEGKNCRILQRDRRDQPALDELRNYLVGTSQRPFRVQLANYRADGTPFVNLLTLTRIWSSDSKTCLLLGSQFDVSRATSRDLNNYHETLGDNLDNMSRALGDHDLAMMTTLHALADTASTVARARIMLDDLEAIDPLS